MPSPSSEPNLPLADLAFLAFNLRWTWNEETRELFRSLDPELWEATHRNPVLMLHRIDRDRLKRAAADERFLARFHDVLHYLREYLVAPTLFQSLHPTSPLRVAYFAAEFGLAECIPLYSGGLGVLSGDHLKSASELGIPLTGVGLLYRHGYFTQRFSSEGEQLERYPITHFTDLPVSREMGDDGRTLSIRIGFPERDVWADVWSARVGRVRLLLLDTRVETNRPADQVITGALYAGDRETRLQQEIVLGIGGHRALVALGLTPNICHLNEGHAAFMVLERIRHLMKEEGLTFAQAREAARAGNVFTTHTPVPAGFDAFEPELLRRYLEPYASELSLSWPELLALGGSDGASPFRMVVLALNNSARSNAVSALHAEVSRGIFRSFQPPQNEAAERIESVANGIHTRSWIAPEMKELLSRHLGPRWLDYPVDAALWNRVEAIPDGELWEVRRWRRTKLVEWVRTRLPQQLERRGTDPGGLAWTKRVLDPEALTIGWARRFTTYKRPLLLFGDPNRLQRLLTDPERPIQIVLAGKAHPYDQEGRRQIREVAAFAAHPALRQRVVLLADYDIAVARMLVRGVDLWINTPRRPLEASGTSGMKAAPNGGLNLSVLDGWWAEAFDPAIGWSFGGPESQGEPEQQDEEESRRLYELLETEIVPLFYRKDAEGLPRGWIAMVKASIRRLCPVYNTNRMVAEYLERFYLPGLRSVEVAAPALASAAAEPVVGSAGAASGAEAVAVDLEAASGES